MDRCWLAGDAPGVLFFVAGEKTAGKARRVLVMLRMDSNADGSLQKVAEGSKSQLCCVFREDGERLQLTERGPGAEYGPGLGGVDPVPDELWQVAGYEGLFQLWFLNH